MAPDRRGNLHARVSLGGKRNGRMNPCLENVGFALRGARANVCLPGGMFLIMLLERVWVYISVSFGLERPHGGYQFS